MQSPASRDSRGSPCLFLSNHPAGWGEFRLTTPPFFTRARRLLSWQSAHWVVVWHR